MGIILRIDIEKPYGNHTCIRKLFSKIIENYYPTAPRIPGYLDHLKMMWSGKTGLEKSQIKPEITHPYETRTKKVHQ